jgi:hypothetical protein
VRQDKLLPSISGLSIYAHSERQLVSCCWNSVSLVRRSSPERQRVNVLLSGEIISREAVFVGCGTVNVSIMPKVTTSRVTHATGSLVLPFVNILLGHLRSNCCQIITTGFQVLQNLLHKEQ